MGLKEAYLMDVCVCVCLFQPKKDRPLKLNRKDNSASCLSRDNHIYPLTTSHPTLLDHGALMQRQEKYVTSHVGGWKIRDTMQICYNFI